jgi:hypothetical protein
VITIFINDYNGRVDMCTGSYGKNIVFYYLCGISGTLFIFSLSWLLNSYTNKFVRTISLGTVILIGFNLLSISVAKKMISFIAPHLEISTIVGSVISVAILIAFYPIILFLQKRFSTVLGK